MATSYPWMICPVPNTRLYSTRPEPGAAEVLIEAVQHEGPLHLLLDPAA